jgi:hypothetical protein
MKCITWLLLIGGLLAPGLDWAGDAMPHALIAVPESAADSTPGTALSATQKQQLEHRREAKRTALEEKLGKKFKANALKGDNPKGKSARAAKDTAAADSADTTRPSRGHGRPGGR